MTSTTTASLSTVGQQYHSLRGLFMVPTGFLLIAAGLFNMPPIGDEEVPAGAPWFLGALVVAAAGYYLADRYYGTHVGRIEPSRATRVRVSAYTVGAAVVICAGITIDAQLHWPVLLYGAAFAVSLLAYYRLFRVLRPHHVAVLGGLAVLCLVPAWGGIDDRTSAAMIPMGLASIAVGLYDHRDLMRSIGALRARGVAGGLDARA